MPYGIRAAAGLFMLACAAPLICQDPASLLKPKALAKPAPETLPQIRKNFTNPPAEYRSMPLWVWNDEMEWPRLKEQLGQMQRQGMGGVFVHPRPGLMTEYLGDDWFRLWGQSMAEGKRLGMQVNIYDENSYPAGFAGGHVPSRAPDTAVQYIEGTFGRFANDALTVSAFAVVRNGETGVKSARRVFSAAEIKGGETALVFRLKRQRGNPWTASFPYVDLIEPETTKQFIATTFEPYKKHFGAEYGKTVKWTFNDEPHLQSGSSGEPAIITLPLSRYILGEFHKRCNYELADNLASLFWDTGDFRKVRFDYWQTMHDLWKENYFKPLYEWCDKSNIGFTGHWLEHSWPVPYTSPADASFYAYEHMPGIDMLEGVNIRTKGQDPHMLFTIKQVASASHQMGRRTFCEAYGVAGWDSTFEHYKRFGDWLMVHGIDFIDQHLAFATVRGARKRDHPQSFSDVSPWWPYYKLHGDHVGRVSYMLSRGEAKNRLLVLVPTTSGFLVARKAEAVPEFGQMQRDNGALMQYLADRQVDYDTADEYFIEWFGKQEGRKFAIGKAAYDLIVWPRNMTNVRHQMLPHLEKYLAAGGQVVAIGPAAEYVDGRPNSAVQQLSKRYASQWMTLAGLPELVKEVQSRLTPRVAFDRELPAGIGFSERLLENGERIVFFANTGLTRVQTKATLDGGGTIEKWDSETGESKAIAELDLDLPPAGSAMFLVKQEGRAVTPESVAPMTKVQTGEWRIAADSPNVLVLDYCDLTMGGNDRKDTNTWRANWLLWQEHGFERPAWDNAVQFKKTVYDRNHFPPASGFDAVFRFEVADAAALAGLQLAMETPELYKVTVNGTAVDFKPGERWLDPHIRGIKIEKLARAGVNEIRISGRPFDVRMELENIYLRGNFSVVAAAKGFRIAAPSALTFGSWAKQGRPFYGDAVTYSTPVELPAGSKRMSVDIGEWQGSVVAVLLDGKQVSVLGWQPYVAEFAATPGKHTVGVRIVSTPHNIFGPFHNPAKPRMRSWPGSWAAFAETQPAGAAYDVLDYGLTAPPNVSAR